MHTCEIVYSVHAIYVVVGTVGTKVGTTTVKTPLQKS